MGLFSPRKKKITFLVMVGLSGQPLSEVWGVLRSTQALTTLAEYGLAVLGHQVGDSRLVGGLPPSAV